LRYLIGGLAALAVAIVAAVLLVQHFFDERLLALRLQQAVADATGVELVIEGGLDLSLLPRPVLSVHRLRLDDAAGDLLLTADRLDLDLELRPLLAGELGVTDAHLVRPDLRVIGNPATAASRLAAFLGASLPGEAVQRIRIADGALQVTGADGAAPLVWRGIDAVLTGDRVTGTSHLAAGAAFAGVAAGPRLVLGGELGSAAPGRPRALRLDLALEGTASAVLGYRGQLRPDGGPDRQGALLDGRLTLDLPDPAGLRDWLALVAPALAAWPVPEAPLGLEAELSFAPAAAADPMFLRLGGLALTVAGQTLDGALDLVGGEAPVLDLQLRAGRLELPDDWPAAGDPRRLAAVLPADLRGHLELEVDQLDWRRRSFRQIAIGLGLEGDGDVRVERAVAVLPGPGDLDFTGRVGPLGSATGHWLSGRLQAALQVPGELLALFGEPPAMLRQSTTLALDTDLDWSAAALTLRNADLSLDATRVEGGIAWRPAVDGKRAQLALRLMLDRLDLGEVVDVHDPRATIDTLEAILPATDYAVDLKIERASLDERRLGALTLRLDSVDGEVAISRASLDGLAGSALMLSGRVTPASRAFDLDLAFDIASLGRLLRLVDYPAPPALALLGPVNLRASLTGDAASTTIDATLDGDSFGASASGVLDDWTTARLGGTLALTLGAADAAGVLRQLGGVPITAAVFTGPLDADLQLLLTDGRPTAWNLEASLGGLDLDLAREPGTEGEAERLDLAIGPLSPAAAAVVYELATPLLQLVPGPPGRWLGFWPDQSLRFDWLDGEPRAIRIELVPEASPAAPVVIEADLADGVLAVPAFAWENDGMRLAGSMALEHRHAGAAAALSLDLALDGATATRLGELLDLPAGVTGEVGLEARVTSLGRSVRTLIGNASGEAAIALENGAIGAVPVDRLAGDLMLERGVLRPVGDGIPFAGPEGSGSVTGAVDLLAWLADLELELTPAAPGAPARHQRLLDGLRTPAPSD
jgi:hypothetical protein